MPRYTELTKRATSIFMGNTWGNYFTALTHLKTQKEKKK